MLAQLAVSDAAILPSRWENLHAAALEALGVGLPVVCGAQSGLAGWVGVDDGLATIDLTTRWPLSLQRPTGSATTGGSSTPATVVRP